MSERELRGLFAALEEACADGVTVGALADWFEEHGDATAATCLRWALTNGRRPGVNPRPSYGQFFWEREGNHFIINDPPAQLRENLWVALSGNGEPHEVGSFKSYKTVRAAYEALIAAWKRIGGAGPVPG